MLQLSDYIIHISSLGLTSESFKYLAVEYTEVLRKPLTVDLFNKLGGLFTNWEIIKEGNVISRIQSAQNTILIDCSMDVEWILFKGYKLELTENLKTKFKLI